MAKILKNDATKSRWHSTGFMAGGVASVDADKHTLHGAQVIRPGEALGHGMWIDAEMCKQILTLGNSGKAANGLKARFGHPNMCNEALGTFLGRWKNFQVSANGGVTADLFLSSTAEESPKGNLRKYIEELAAKEPNHFGASIVFTRDQNAEIEFLLANGATVDGEYIDCSGFKSPDPANVNNLPHARAYELHAADLVDDPAATDGMFSGAGGLSLAAQVTEFLDLNPKVFEALNKDAGMIDVLSRYGKELAPFIERYQANKKLEAVAEPVAPASEMPEDNCPTCGGTGKKQSEPMAESIVETKPELSAETDKAEIVKLGGELAAATTRADTAEATIKTLTVERDELARKLELSETNKAAAEAQRNEAQKRLEAFESGQSPVSSQAVPEKPKGSFWDEVRASKKQR